MAGGRGGAPVLPARTAVRMTIVTFRIGLIVRPISALHNSKGRMNRGCTRPVPRSPNALHLGRARRFTQGGGR